MAEFPYELEGVIDHLQKCEANLGNVKLYRGQGIGGKIYCNIEFAMHLSTIDQFLRNDFIQIAGALVNICIVDHSLAEYQQIGNQLTKIIRLLAGQGNILLKSRFVRVKHSLPEILQKK